jgi:phytoene/squalene synthetase
VYDTDKGEDTTVDPIYKVDGRYLFKEQLQQEAPELVDVLEPIQVTELVDLFQELRRGQCSLSKDSWKDDTWTAEDILQPTHEHAEQRALKRARLAEGVNALEAARAMAYPTVLSSLRHLYT